MLRVWGQVLTDGVHKFSHDESRTQSGASSTKVEHHESGSDTVKATTTIKGEHEKHSESGSSVKVVESGHIEKHSESGSGVFEVLGGTSVIQVRTGCEKLGVNFVGHERGCVE